MDRNNFFQTSDGAMLYYEDRGRGTPLILVPGFMCTTRFYERNVGELSKKYRVITFDPRGYGLSSKTLQGNTLKGHARDIKELIDFLDLDGVVLMGWSLGTSAVAVYAHEYREYRLSGIGFIDAFLSPFAHGEWNKYKFSGYKVREYISGRSLWFTDPDKYHRYFFDTVDCKELTPEDEKWITGEISLTMPWTGIELHLDTCHTDTMSYVEQFTVPTVVFAGNSKGVPACVSEEACRRMKCPHRYHYYDHGGHMFFYTDPETFNRQVDAFIQEEIITAKRGGERS